MSKRGMSMFARQNSHTRLGLLWLGQKEHGNSQFKLLCSYTFINRLSYGSNNTKINESIKYVIKHAHH